MPLTFCLVAGLVALASSDDNQFERLSSTVNSCATNLVAGVSGGALSATALIGLGIAYRLIEPRTI